MDSQFHVGVDSYLSFDFGSFDLVCFEEEVPVSREVSPSQTLTNELQAHVTYVPSQQLMKRSDGNGGVKKSKRIYFKKKSPFKRGMSVKEALVAGGSMPNMSRRPPTNVLVAFPHYDKCDSLIYFPHTMCRNMNSANMDAFTKLIRTHLDKDCDIHIFFGSTDKLSTKSLIRYTDIANEIEPDRIMCVHSTKVVENKITATIYHKQTDSQQLFNFMSHTLRDPHMDFGSIIYRSQRFELYDKDQSLTPYAVQELMFHASLEEDLLVYLQSDLVLTFDDTTKKIIGMEWVGRLTSAQPVVLPRDVLDST